MLKNTLESSAVNRLKLLVQERFGRTFEIRHVRNISSPNDSKPYMKGESYVIPLIHNDNSLGEAVIPDALNLTLQAKEQAADMIKLVLEPTLYSWFLERAAANIEQQISDSNIDFNENNTALDDEPDDLFGEILDEEPQLITNFIHLSGSNSQLIKKVALQVHELAHRWAFLPFADIRQNISSVDDLIKLGAMTILIDDIEELSNLEMDLLIEFNQEPRGDDAPLIISASGKSLTDLESGGRVSSTLIDEVSINFFEVERAPIGYAALNEVLELFFFKSNQDFHS